MKAYLILSILLATILFFPSSILARELAADHGTQPGTGSAGRNMKPCNHDKGQQYNCDAPKPTVPKRCNKYSKGCSPSGS